MRIRKEALFVTDKLTCPKCKKDLPPESAFCMHCGRNLTTPVRKPRTRPNGTGTAYKRGSKWEARVIVGWEALEDGSLKPVVRTKSGFNTKRDALEYCPTLKTSSGGNKIRSTATFSTIFEEVIARHKERNRSKSTIVGYHSAFKYFKKIQHIKMDLISSDGMQACIDACPRGKRTKENMKAIAGLIFKYAMEKDVIEKNYAAFLYTGENDKGTRPPFTMDEVEVIRKAVGSVPYADYIYFMIYTGYRPEEMLSRLKEDYDEKNNCIYGGIKTTAGKERIVTISPKVQNILDARLLVESDYLFPRIDTGQRMTSNYFRKFCFSPCMEALKITGRVPYSARHTFSNLLKNITGSDTDKAALMGHKDTSMTKQYQSADIQSLKDITNNL